MYMNIVFTLLYRIVFIMYLVLIGTQCSRIEHLQSVSVCRLFISNNHSGLLRYDIWLNMMIQYGFRQLSHRNGNICIFKSYSLRHYLHDVYIIF